MRATRWSISEIDEGGPNSFTPNPIDLRLAVR